MMYRRYHIEFATLSLPHLTQTYYELEQDAMITPGRSFDEIEMANIDLERKKEQEEISVRELERSNKEFEMPIGLVFIAGFLACFGQTIEQVYMSY